MLPSELVNKPVHQWTLGDLRLICKRQSEESQTLEFKEQLPLDNGSRGWANSGKLNRTEKQGLAKEIVALANAYGGHVIVGIKESDENPKRAVSLASPIAKLADFAEAIRSSVGGNIDPPVNGLVFQPIPELQDNGYLVVYVPQSVHAPHGFGEPPEVHIRRADRSEPMTMRDMQSVFWEARTRKERVDQELANFGEQFENYRFEADRLAFAFCAVSENPASFNDVVDRFKQINAMKGKEAYPLSLFDTGNIGASVESPSNFQHWVPGSKGAVYSFNRRSLFDENLHQGRWIIDDSGMVGLIANKEGYSPQKGRLFEQKEDGLQVLFDQAEHVAALKQFLDLIRIFSKGYEPFTSRWIVKGWVKSGVEEACVRDHRGINLQIDLTQGVDFRPMLINLDNLLDWPTSITKRLWESFGTEVPSTHLDYLGKILADHWSQW